MLFVASVIISTASLPSADFVHDYDLPYNLGAHKLWPPGGDNGLFTLCLGSKVSGDAGTFAMPHTPPHSAKKLICLIGS